METQKEMMNRLYVEYGLTPEDIFAHPKNHYKIITRQGIDKIVAKSGIKLSYETVKLEYIPVVIKNNYTKQEDTKVGVFCVIKAFAERVVEAELKTVETYGEVSPYNCTNEYPIAMAEKRAMSRAALKLAGLYEEGFFGEDEADDFRKMVSEQRKSRAEVKK